MTTQELLPDAVVEYARGSIDFVTGIVRDRNDNNLTMGVEIAITDEEDAAAGTYAWLPASWTGTAAPERAVTTTSPVTLNIAGYPSERYGVYVRLDNSPAHPIFRIGTLVLTE